MRLWKSRLAAFVIAGLGIALAVGAWVALQKREAQNVHETTRIEARRAQEKLQAMLQTRIDALTRMARRWELQGDFREDLWADHASRYYADMPGFQVLGWVSHAGAVGGMVPYKGNEVALGLPFLTIEARHGREPRRREALLRAWRTGVTQVTRTVELVQAGTGFLVYAPIGHGERFVSAIYAAFRLDSTVHTILGEDFLHNFAVRIFDGAPEVYKTHMTLSSQSLEFEQSFDIGLLDTSLRFAIAPSASWLVTQFSPLPNTVLVGGSLMACLLAFVVWLLQGMRERNAYIYESALQQKVIFDHAVQSIIVTDAKGNILGFNRGAEAMLGYRARDMVGKQSPLIFYEPAALQKMAAQEQARTGVETSIHFGLLVRQAVNGQVEQREVNYVRQDGTTVPVLLTITGVRNQVGEIVSYIAVGTNISAQHAASQALLLAKQTAEETSRLRSQFFAQMSHEIRTPLNGILGMTELMLETRLNAEQRKYANIINSSGQGLMALVNDILDLAKLEAGKLRLEEIEFDPVTLVENQTEIFVARAREKRLAMSTRIDPQICRRVQGDPSRIGQVLLNLISNAIKFTERGIIIIAVEQELVDAKHVTLRFSVEDSGIGLSEATRASLFQPFVQGDVSTARKYGGTGLGLTICRQLVELWHGDIGVQSNAAAGSSFSFTYTMRASFENHQTHADALQGAHVLVTSQWPQGLAVGRHYFGAWGAKVSCAKDGNEAIFQLHKARDAGDPIGVVVLSQFIADKEPDIAARLRRETHNTALPIVLVAQYDYRARQRNTRETFDGLLTLPARMDEMRECCVQVLRGEKYQSGDNHQPVRVAVAAKKSCRILVVDDNAVNQTLVLSLLRKLGHQVEAVGDGAQALDAVATKHFDLVLMDCQMPVMDGYEATRKMRDQERDTGSHLPIVALTAQAMHEDEQRCLAAGMDAYLTKPIRRDALFEVLGQFLPT